MVLVWPCVITIPLTFSLFFTRYETSGITKSIPSISSVGNSSPQSTTMISLSYSKTVIFFPISSIPPKGIIFIEGLLNLNSSLFAIDLCSTLISPFSTFAPSLFNPLDALGVLVDFLVLTAFSLSSVFSVFL